MKPIAVDPRAWNIAAGLCLVSGCGNRAVGADTNGSESGEASESNTTLDSTNTSAGPECVTDADCPGLGYYCINGMCEYVVGDGYSEGPDIGCYVDVDCLELELCEYNFCQPVRSPETCQPADPVPSLMIPVASLALSFADVDDDGAEELVVATQSELQVYESGLDMPLVSPRGLDSDSIDAMAGAPFDAMPGEDVVILYADELRLHASDGVGNFAAPSVSASSCIDSVGLLAAELDAAPADMLIWGGSGAWVELGDGNAIPVSLDVMISSATARSITDPVPGLVLQRDDFLDFYDGVGAAIDTAQMRGHTPYALTSIAQIGDGFDLSSSVIDSGNAWTIIEEWGPATGNLGEYWGLLGRVTAMVGGDFDGDARSDVALIVDGTVQVQLGVLTDTTCLALYPFAGIATNVVVGDHDGDADDELAIRFEGGNVAVIDAE